MRVLSVRAPWAWLLVFGGKDVENRGRSLGAYRGPVAVHVSSTVDEEWAERDSWEPAAAAMDRWRARSGALPGVPGPWFDHAGKIIGVVDLVDVHDPTDALFTPTADTVGVCSPWAERGAFHLVVDNPRPLTTPVAFKGGLGLRTLDQDTVALIAERLTS